MKSLKNKSVAEISEICKELKRAGKMPVEIVKYLKDHGLHDWNRQRVKNCTCRVKAETKIGQTERKPKYKFNDGVYVIFYGKNKKITTSDTELQKALSLYCTAGLTLNQVANQMGWTRDEFYAIKTAFGITKDSLPFTPEQIDNLTPDEIAEKVRTEKKKYALQKYQDSKYKDIKKEVDKFNRSDYWYSEFIDKINKIEPVLYPAVKLDIDNEIERLLIITDIHSGLKINSPWNTYNFEIMKQRFNKLASEICSTVKPCRLTIAELGDSVHGIIHGSVKKHSENVIDSVFQVTECLSNLFVTLLSAGFSIRFTKVNGNHSSIEASHSDRTDEESFGRLIYWGLKLKFENFNQIEFIEPVYNMSLLKFFDYSIICCHGHQGDIKRLAEIERMWRNDNVIEVQSGHLHHRKIEEFNGISVFYNECFCGNDHYSISKALGSNAGCRLVTYDKSGRKEERLIRLNDNS